MTRVLVATFTALLSVSATVSSNQEPLLPYYDHGACPFECCTYRMWSASNEMVLREHFSDSARIVSTVRTGEYVRGLTGVVITSKPRKVVIQKAMKLHKEGKETEVSLKPGDVLYYLHYVGAGYDKFWYRGQLLVDQTDIRKVGKGEWFEVLNLPEWVWWAKIQRPNGDVGWTRELDKFKDIDACG